VEREVTLSRLALSDLLGSIHRRRVAFPDTDQRESISGSSGDPVGVVRRRQAAIELEIEVAVRSAGEDAYVIGVEIDNLTERVPSPAHRDELLSVCLVAVHTILTVESGDFASLIDPPAALREATAQCRNVGTWPVLAGPPGTRDTMLSSPIILYDYPEIAPESRGDLFDGTEIDEILSLRIMTLTDEEKSEIRRSDERARLLLERTESLAAEQMMKLHGTMRPVQPTEAS
jgi:hydrogenase maturation protease